MSFVRAKNLACESWGIGKIVEVQDSKASISWFDSPFIEPVVKDVGVDCLIHVILERQTRVYWLDRGAATWRVGRVVDADDTRAQVRFSNLRDVVLGVSELEVRWDRPISDPSTFLAAQLNESPQFAQARTRFAKSLVTQRGACSGMTALVSSVIELELHQYEVVKRVLQDPIQRYLLADEVGLGKTIEAGVLIRQYVLDDVQNHQVLVITPPALVVQWRRELRKRFLLADLLDDSLLVMPMDAGIRELREALLGAGMVVVDEAHHLSHDRDLYSALRGTIIEVPRVLLLSATPVLHNERGFLEMLHLLDPHVHRLESEQDFRKRIEHRQTLAESVAGLVPENLLQIEDFLDDIIERFPDDTLLQEHSLGLRDIVRAFPNESDPTFKDALFGLRVHLSETYRLDRRILRNRRRDNPLLTPRRSGVERIDYSSADVARVVQIAEVWRSFAAESVYGKEDSKSARVLASWFQVLLQAVLTESEQLGTLVQKRLDLLKASPGNFDRENRILVELRTVIDQCSPERERLSVLANVVESELKGNAKVVIFCSHPHVADAAAQTLRGTLGVPIDRHESYGDYEDDDTEHDWERFLLNPAHRVLVCDAIAEEGLNLQGAEQVVIHFDLPLAPNRIEQRLGRVDRFGSGNAIRSITLCCKDDPYALGWFVYLDKGLRIFDRSVASLQYLIEDEMNAVTQALFLEGAEAFEALTERTSGRYGSAERELRRIDDQDSLDALTHPREEARFETLTDVDGNWRDIRDGVWQWIIEILQVKVEAAPELRTGVFGFGAFRFCFSYDERGRNTLIPLKRILSALVQTLDPRARGAHSKLLKSDLYTCRRGAAVGASAPRDGIRLVRIGETLVDRMKELTDLDDRGRSVAMWRRHSEYNLRSDVLADVYLRFDFIVEASVSKVLMVSENSNDPAVKRALERRGDMAFSPFYKTVWVDDSLSLVSKPNILELLEDPYRRSPSEGAYEDWNLNAERWPIVQRIRLPAVDIWHNWIPQARKAAEEYLRKETNLQQLCEEAVVAARQADEARFAQLRIRGRYADEYTAEAARVLLVSEEALSQSLYAAIREPSVTLGTVAAVFLSPHSLPSDG